MELSITDQDFDALRNIMYEKTGVRLSDAKKPLVVGRLRKRLEELGIDFRGYIARVGKPNSEELELFINAITTNETYFFRHEKQFQYLTETIFPELLNKKLQVGGKKEICIWSAASSTGEEPYSIAIAAKEFFKGKLGWQYKIYASDVNSIVLDACRKGQYPERSVSRMPKDLKEKYFTLLKSDSPYKSPKFQLSSEIIKTVNFRQHNLLSVAPYQNVDIIFLRNVMIYFDRKSKQTVMSAIEKSLTVGGYFIISLSESLFDVQCSLKNVSSGVFQNRVMTK